MAPPQQILSLEDISGGVSDEHPLKMADNQVEEAWDVDFWDTTFLARRNGCTTLATGLSQPHLGLFRHTPSANPDANQLWAFNQNGSVLFYPAGLGGTTPVTQSPNDSFNFLTGIDAVSFRGKMFVAGKNNQDRLHVFDGSVLRRTGFAQAANLASVTNTGAGAYTSPRQFRVRLAQMSGSTVLRQSEPSDVTQFVPSGAGAAARLTFGALLGEGETHWVIEQSVNNADFYVIAYEPVASAFYDDTTPFADVDGGDFDLAEDIGDYVTGHSGRWLLVDEDRLLMAGSFEDNELDARVMWTPQSNMTGVGNDERFPADTDSFVDLDVQVGGAITGMATFESRVLVFKRNRIYMLIRNNSRTRAYTPQIITNRYGALPYSVKEGADQNGHPCVYFIDEEEGPMIMGRGGVRPVAPHLKKKFVESVNLNATQRYCAVLAYHHKNQVWFFFATGSSNRPNQAWVLNTHSQGITFMTVFDGAYTAILWNDFPYVATATRICKYDTPEAQSDDGTAFRSYIKTKAFALGDLMHEATLGKGIAVGVPDPGIEVEMKIIRNFGAEEKPVNIDLTPLAAEEFVIKPLDDAQMGELTTVQFEIGDPLALITEPWVIESIKYRYSLKSRT